MSSAGDWLPPLISLAEHNGDWDSFERAVYAEFRAGWVRSMPELAGEPGLAGKRMALKAHPLRAGRGCTYYHLTSEGDDEAARRPDEWRMERIRWPRAMVEAIGTGRVLVWRTGRRIRGGRKPRVVIALPDFSYIVVLEDRGAYVLLWTAYAVAHKHQRAKLRRGYEDARRDAEVAPGGGDLSTPSTPGR